MHVASFSLRLRVVPSHAAHWDDRRVLGCEVTHMSVRTNNALPATRLFNSYSGNSLLSFKFKVSRFVFSVSGDSGPGLACLKSIHWAPLSVIQWHSKTPASSLCSTLPHQAGHHHWFLAADCVVMHGAHSSSLIIWLLNCVQLQIKGFCFFEPRNAKHYR